MLIPLVKSMLTENDTKCLQIYRRNITSKKEENYRKSNSRKKENTLAKRKM